MRLYKLKRETTEGNFGFYNAQLYVGELSLPSGNRVKGMAIQIPNRWAEIPFEVKREDAKSLALQLKQVTPTNPILNASIPVGRLLRLRISLSHHLDKWLESDGYSGNIFLGWAIFGNWVPIKVTRKTLSELSNCLERFYLK